jgi:hypothetical protein
MSSLPELIERNVLPLVTHGSNQFSFVDFDVLLPDAAATYLITIHVAPGENIPLADLLRRFGLKLIQTIGGWNPTKAFYPAAGMTGIGPGAPGPAPIPSSEIQLAPLSVDSGFVGIMTPVTDYVALYISCNTAEEPVLFGGLTIMRL